MTVYTDTPEAMEDPDAKKVTYHYFNETCGAWECVGNSIEALQKALELYADDLEDGDKYEFRIWRNDMTQAEIDELPELPLP